VDYATLLQRSDTFYNHFDGHALPEKYSRERVKFPGSVLQASREQYKKADPSTNMYQEGVIQPEKSYLLETITRSQRWTNVFQNPTRLSLTLRYAESQPTVDPLRYATISGHLLSDINYKADIAQKIDTQDFLQMQGSKWLANLIECAQAEDGRPLRTTISECLGHIWAFEQKTGDMVDMTGVDNVLFFQNDYGDWEWLMHDALYPIIPPKDYEIRNAMADLKSGMPLDSVAVNGLYNRLNFMRGFNGVADAVGHTSSERFRITALKSKEWVKLLGIVRSCVGYPDEKRMPYYSTLSHSVIDTLVRSYGETNDRSAPRSGGAYL
jgi:hypothetical protein